MQYRKAPVHPD